METWLTYLVGAAVLVVAPVLVVLLWRLSRAAAEAERLLTQFNRMSPKIDRVLVEAEAELVELRRVTQKVDSIVESAQNVTRKAVSVAQPVLEGAMVISRPLRYVSAAMVGVQTFMRYFQKRKNGTPEASNVEKRSYRKRFDDAPATSGGDRAFDVLDEWLPKPQDVEA